MRNDGSRFVPKDTDEQELFNVECIVDERRGEYQVRWEGVNPETGRPWALDWVKKSDCTDDLVAEWKEKKALMTEKKKKKKDKINKKVDAKSTRISSHSSKEVDSLAATSSNNSRSKQVPDTKSALKRSRLEDDQDSSPRRKKHRVEFRDAAGESEASVEALTQSDSVEVDGWASLPTKGSDVAEEVDELREKPKRGDAVKQRVSRKRSSTHDRTSRFSPEVITSRPPMESQLLSPHGSPLRVEDETKDSQDKLSGNKVSNLFPPDEEEEDEAPQVKESSRKPMDASDEEEERASLPSSRKPKSSAKGPLSVMKRRESTSNPESATKQTKKRSSSKSTINDDNMEENGSERYRKRKGKPGRTQVQRETGTEDEAGPSDTEGAPKASKRSESIKTSSERSSTRKQSSSVNGKTKPPVSKPPGEEEEETEDEARPPKVNGAKPVGSSKTQRKRTGPKIPRKTSYQFESDPEDRPPPSPAGEPVPEVAEPEPDVDEPLDFGEMGIDDTFMMDDCIPYPPPNQQALITHQETSQEIPETSQILAMDTQTSGDKQYLPSQEIELSPRLLPRTSLRPVPAITPSKFHPYLPTSTPPSPIEEFSPTKSKSREPASTLESIEKSTSSGDRTGKGIPETQERLTQASHISDDLGYVDEPLDAPQTDMDVGVQPMSQVAIDEHNQPLGAMEDAFLDYNAGELISQVEPNHDSLSANAGSDSGQSRLLSQLQSQPVNGGPRRATPSEQRPQTPTDPGSNSLLTKQPTLVAHPTPRTALRRTAALQEYTGDVPQSAYAQLDKALLLLNEKSDEIRRLDELQTRKQQELYTREGEHQAMIININNEYSSQISILRDEKQTFETAYATVKAQAEMLSNERDTLKYENEEIRERLRIVESQLNIGIRQKRVTYETQIRGLLSKLKESDEAKRILEIQSERTADVRRRAAEEPILQEKVIMLTQKLKDLEERCDEQEARLQAARFAPDTSMMDNMRQELARHFELVSNLRKVNRQLKKDHEAQQTEWQERLKGLENILASQVSDKSLSAEQEVIVCRWAVDVNGDWCGVECSDQENLRGHLLAKHLIDSAS